VANSSHGEQTPYHILQDCPLFKELNPRRRVYVEIPKPSRVELKPEALAEVFDVILATPEGVLVSQHRPDDEGLISILK
jgi:hypothetical protein